MSAELRIPEGIVVRTARGGQDILRQIMSDLKQYSFSGYVKVILRRDTINSTGYLVIDQGIPSMSIYQFEKTEPREIKRIYAGDKSMKFILEDSQDKHSVIELHSRVPKEEFDRRFPDAKLMEIELPEFKPLRQPRQEAVKAIAKKTEEIEEAPVEEKGDPILAEINKLRQQGFVVDTLIEAFNVNRTAAKKELAKYQEKIEELKKLENILDNLPQVGFEEEVEALKAGLNNPDQIEDIKKGIDDLRDKIRKQIEQSKIAEKKIEEDIKKKKREEKTGDLYDLILQYQRGQIPQKEVQTCEKCGGILDGKGICQKCQEAEKEKTSPQMAISESMGFSTFVVGKSNKFAYAAAVAVAHSPDKAYNPLYIYGKSGLGKTHLLNAIAKQVLDKNPNESVVLIPAEKFSEDLDKALKKDEIHDFRNGMRNKKVFMIDDFQFMAGKEAAQAELIYLIDDTLRSGGQVVIAGDRLPKEIPRLSDLLVAKIQGGMIADIQPPDKQTRIEILHKKIREKGKDIPEPVTEFIADKVTTNVRELEAALNRLVAFATVMKVGVDLQLVKDILMPTIGQQPEKAITPNVDIKIGHSYLVEEDRPVHSNRLLAKKIQEGFKGIEITRMNPSQIRQEFGVSGEILWLTDKESKNERTIQPSLEIIVHTIEEFMSSGESGVLLIDGLQYLVSNTSFEGVLRFLRRLIDDFSESNSIMMISVSPGTLSTQELSILEREMETLKLDSESS